MQPGASRSSANNGDILVASGLVRRFGALVAVNDFAIAVRAGEIVSLIGPNGAGKTTALNLLSGLVAPNAGSVVLMGQDVTRKSATVRAPLGVGRSFQHPRLIADMTCLENVALGGQGAKARFWMAEDKLLENAKRAMEWVGVREQIQFDYPDRLPPADKRWVELARIIAAEPALVMLDEPTSGFTASEVNVLAQKIQEMARNQIGVLLVTHDVSLAARISHRIVVMNFGQLLMNGQPRDVLNSPEVIKSYLGEKGRELAQRSLNQMNA